MDNNNNRNSRRNCGSGQAYFDKVKKKWYLQFRYTDWTGEVRKSTRRGFKTKREALDWLDDFLKSKHGDLSMKFGDFVDVYNADMANRLRLTTIISKKYITDLKILPYFKDFPVNEITIPMIRQWESDLLGKGYAKTYLRTIYNQLNCIFNYAVRYYGLKINPCREAGSIGKNKADEMNFWTFDEFNLFSEAIIDKRASYVGFKVLFWTGVRIGELLALTVGCFNAEQKTLSVIESFQRITRKDILSDTKTEKGKRIITLPEFLVSDINDYIDSIYDAKSEDRLFPFTKSYFENEMKRGVKISGVKKIRIHDIRHSHCALLVFMGFSYQEIADRLGHKLETTISTYSHLYPERKTQIAEKLNEVFKKEQNDAGTK